MKENRDGADEISIESLRMENSPTGGVVKYSQKNFFHLPSAEEKLTKDGSLGV
jgi:hypothetical protein